MSSIPTFDVGQLGSALVPGGHGGPPRLDPKALFTAFRELGFVALVGHGIDAALVEPAYDAVRRFFALPAAVKLRYQLKGRGGARGYTPFGVERAKDQQAPDLKEFWHVGRELPAGHDDALLPNVWPDEVPEFRPALLALYGALDQLGARVLSALAVELGQPADYFTHKIDRGNSILRPLHYPPLPASVSGVRSAAHEDINLITLMVIAGEAGLQILRRNGSWLPVRTEPGEVIVNIGDMLQRLTNHVLPSTTHRVVNPTGAAAARARYSLPFFLHLNPEVEIRSLPTCVSAERPDSYPDPITADAYLRQRLREIGLL